MSWLWIGGTKEVRAHAEMNGDPGRFAAVEGWYTQGHVKRKTNGSFI